MTVNANPRRDGPYTGTGLIVAYPFSFKIFEDTDLLIVRAEIATGITTDLVIDSDYSVFMNPDQENNPGGTVSYLVGGVPTALPITQSLTIVGNLPFTQPIDITNQGGFYPEVIEDGLDRVTMLVQQNEDAVSRALQLNVATDPGFDVQMPAPVPFNVLGWDSAGLQLVNFDSLNTAPIVAAQLAQYIANVASGTGSTLVGFTQAGAGARVRDLQDRGRDWVSVGDFTGADPTGATNSNAAFQSAIINGNAHRAIYVPPGIWTITPELFLGVYKKLVGAGRDVTTIRVNMTTANGAALLVDQYCHIEGITFENVGTNKTTSIGLASYTPTVNNGMANCVIRDCRFIGFGFAIGATIAVGPAVQQIVRSQAFNTKVHNNIFYDCLIPIQLGLGANAIDIEGNWFMLTRGNYNVYLSECFQPIIGKANSFQGCLMQDVYLQSCFQPIVQGYFEPAIGIFADSCPGLDVTNCILNGQAFTAGNNLAFVRTTAASNAGGYNYPLPIKSRVRNVTLDGNAASTRFCVNNDANCETLTDNISQRQIGVNAWTVNGARAYPEFFEGPWTPALQGDGTAGTLTYGANNAGWYTQRGKKISAYYRLNWSAAPTPPTGNLRITGLPSFVSSSTNGGLNYAPPALMAQWTPVTLSANMVHLGGTAIGGTQRIDLIQSSSNGTAAAALPASAITTFGTIIGQADFEAA